MARLILFLFVLALVLLAAAAVLAMAKPAGRAPARRKEGAMPDAVRWISYGLLLAVMFGAASGWVGSP